LYTVTVAVTQLLQDRVCGGEATIWTTSALPPLMELRGGGYEPLKVFPLAVRISTVTGDPV
jgi:hypothetical protein